MPLLIVRVTPVKSQQGLTNHADFWTHKADTKLTWMETINSTLWGKGKFQLWIFTLDKNRKILYFVVHAGQGYTYLSQTPNIRLTYLHILHIWSHIQGVGNTFSILQGINATVIILSAKISNDFGNPCIALTHLLFFFSLTLSLIIIRLTLSKVKLSLSSFSNIQHPSAWVSIVKWWYLGEHFHVFFFTKALFWTHEPPIFQTIELLTDQSMDGPQTPLLTKRSSQASFFFLLLLLHKLSQYLWGLT